MKTRPSPAPTRPRVAHAQKTKSRTPPPDSVPSSIIPPDPLSWDHAGLREINFSIADPYNASEVLFQNLTAERAHRLALFGPAGQRSYAELCADAARWGHALLSLGLTRGTRVALLLEDTPVYPAAFFGALRAGLVPVLLNVLMPSEEVRFCIEDSEATAAISEASLLARFADCGSCLQRLIAVNDQRSLDSAALPPIIAEEWLPRFPDVLAPADTHKCDMALMIYSSGSTGRPKGIVHLQHDMAYTQASYGQHALRLSPDDRCFSAAKMFFSYGLGNSITFPFSVGAASLLMPERPTPAAVLAMIEQYRPTVFFGVPSLYANLVRDPRIRTADLSTLRFAVSAAEPLPADIADAWTSLTGVALIDCLGATELLNVYISNTPTERKRGSVGRRVPGYEIALKDARGSDVPDGTEGTMWIRGHSSTPYYWKRPKETAQTIRGDGWMCTRDRFVRDQDGFYFFRGRADDRVKISGQWVHPVEVQNCLIEHSSVRECLVLAAEGRSGQNVLTAFVVRDDRQQPVTARMLQDYVKQRLLPHKYPRIVRFVPALPKTGTGKIDRRALLSERANAGRKSRPRADAADQATREP